MPIYIIISTLMYLRASLVMAAIFRCDTGGFASAILRSCKGQENTKIRSKMQLTSTSNSLIGLSCRSMAARQHNIRFQGDCQHRSQARVLPSARNPTVTTRQLHCTGCHNRVLLPLRLGKWLNMRLLVSFASKAMENQPQNVGSLERSGVSS